MKPHADPRGRNRAGGRHLLDAPADLHGGTDGVPRVLAVRERGAKARHEPIAEELIDDAVMGIHDRDQRPEQRVEVVHDFGGRSVFGERREVADVEKQDRHAADLAARVDGLSQELIDDRRRNVLPEHPDDAVFLGEQVQRGDEPSAQLAADEPAGGTGAHHDDGLDGDGPERGEESRRPSRQQVDGERGELRAGHRAGEERQGRG
jgi:hypothetical protein